MSRLRTVSGQTEYHVVAIVDRLTLGGNIIETGTDFYRHAITKTTAANDPIRRPVYYHPRLRDVGSRS